MRPDWSPFNAIQFNSVRFGEAPRRDTLLLALPVNKRQPHAIFSRLFFLSLSLLLAPSLSSLFFPLFLFVFFHLFFQHKHKGREKERATTKSHPTVDSTLSLPVFFSVAFLCVHTHTQMSLSFVSLAGRASRALVLRTAILSTLFCPYSLENKC